MSRRLEYLDLAANHATVAKRSITGEDRSELARMTTQGWLSCEQVGGYWKLAPTVHTTPERERLQRHADLLNGAQF